MEVRPARPDEYDAIGDLIIEAYRDLRGGASLGDYENELSAVGDRAVDCTVLVADDDGGMLGTVTYVPGPDTALSEFADRAAAGIRMLAVHPRHQGNGVGKALTQACIDLARSDGWARIILHSTDMMRVARAMYERSGFEPAPDLDILITEPPHSIEAPLRLIAYVLTL